MLLKKWQEEWKDNTNGKVKKMGKKIDFKMLHELMDIEAVSGNEGPVREYIHEKIAPYVDVISVDKMGDLICHKKGKKPSKPQ